MADLGEANPEAQPSKPLRLRQDEEEDEDDAQELG